MIQEEKAKSLASIFLHVLGFFPTHLSVAEIRDSLQSTQKFFLN